MQVMIGSTNLEWNSECCTAILQRLWDSAKSAMSAQVVPLVPVKLVHELPLEIFGVERLLVAQEVEVGGEAQPAGDDEHIWIHVVHCFSCLGDEHSPICFVLARTSELIPQAHGHHERVAAESAGHGGEPLHPRIGVEVQVSPEAIPVVVAAAPLGLAHVVVQYHHQGMSRENVHHSAVNLPQAEQVPYPVDTGELYSHTEPVHHPSGGRRQGRYWPLSSACNCKDLH